MSDYSQLLSRLSPQDNALLLSKMTKVRLETGRILSQPSEMTGFCYFPCGTALAGSSVVLTSGVAVETLIVGREGAMGATLSNGPLPAYGRSQVINGGCFYRIALRELYRAKAQSSAIGILLSRYADYLLAQVSQSIACNAVHSIEHRAAKWLVATAERMGGGDIQMTQEQLASMIGVGRSYACRVVQGFKVDGLLRTRRGGFVIVDSAGLERRSCSCADQLRQYYDAVFANLYDM